MSSHDFFDFVIVGGGIAGVVCAETLCELIRPSRFGGGQSRGYDARVALISATPTVKTTVNLRRITNMIESFDVSEASANVWSETWPGTLEIFCDTVRRLDPTAHLIYLGERGPDSPIHYGRLCLTTGAVPRLVAKENPFVIGLRDTESLATFQTRLRDTRRMVLVGNGGIATEIAHEVTGCQIVWAIKDNSISTPFLDPAAAKFLLCARELARSSEGTAEISDGPSKAGDSLGPVQIRRMRYVVDDRNAQQQELVLVPVTREGNEAAKENLPTTFGAALGPDWAHGRTLRGCLSGNNDNRLLRAAKAMFGHSQGVPQVPLDFSFELFSHVTYFFGFKVVLLGLYNGQGLDLTSPDCYLLMRVTPGREYVKCVMRAGRMQGALLIGETDLEETLENLIVNQLDLTHLEDSLLDPDIDLSDYFD
ncbi:hypothetical protein CRM22_006099 [Opisthorchis felineus]|uniref:FAD/NAD(P)-binding domain-containing protein n=1 Tax=Opisthorchis felineus TaxID=147828 RepID=A0A4S2LMV4_OPIFE|nr:hypothetical protein CRM22_006099 [Opisthorchis felineus]